MISIKNLSFIALSLSASSLYSSEPVCHRCEEIREFNSEHHQNFEYYDDYLKQSGNKDRSENSNNSFQKSPNSSKSQAKPISEADILKSKTSNYNDTPKSTDSSGVKTIPSPSTSLPSTGIATPNETPAAQAPQDGTVPQTRPNTSIPH